MFDVNLKDVEDAWAYGQKLAKSYDVKDADEAAIFALIPEGYSDRLRMRIAILDGVRSVKNDNYNFHLLATMFERALTTQAYINRIRTY